MLPDFVIIGAQKSASTFVHLCLSEHPEVYIPKSETPFFQDPDYDPDNLSRLEAYFEGANPSDHQRLGIKRPDYLASPECPRRINRHLPDAQLIAILRNPIDRIVSAYYHYIKTGFLPPVHINKGLKKVLSGGWVTEYPRSVELVEYGMYYKHLKRYLKYFGKTKIKVIFHSNIKKSPKNEIKKICKFLDVSKESIPNNSLEKEPKASVYELDRLARMQRANRLINRYSKDGMRMHRLPIKDNPLLYCWHVLLRIRDFADHVLRGSGSKPNLSPSLLKQLHDRYKKDIQKLEKLLEKDLSKWRP